MEVLMDGALIIQPSFGDVNQSRPKRVGEA